MTDELAHLDGRIEKMEGAIVLAKQRLHIMDDEYYSDFIYPIGNCPTQDEDQEGGKIPIWEFKEGNSSEEDGDRTTVKGKKSLLNVFQRAVSMHENEAAGNNHVSTSTFGSSSNKNRSQMPLVAMRNDFDNGLSPNNNKGKNGSDLVMPTHPTNRTQGVRYSGDSFSIQGPHHRQVHPTTSTGLRGYGDLKERSLEKDIKPPWWD